MPKKSSKDRKQSVRKSTTGPAAAKVRAVDPLARGGKKHLLDHLADMLIPAGVCGAPPAIDPKRIGYFHHIPLTRTWVTTTVRGVPVGAQTAWLSWSNTGCPPANTRVAPTTH